MNKEFNNTILPVLVFKTLIEKTINSEPMTIREIKDYIKEEYQIEISEKTIDRHIKAFRQFDFNDYIIENKIRKGFYVNNTSPLFDDSEINYIKSVLQKSKNMTKDRRQEMMNKLDKLGGANLNKKDVIFAQTSENERKDYSSIIDLISAACNENKKVSITYIAKRKEPFNDLNYFVFQPYLHLIRNEDRLVVGYNEETKKVGFLQLSKIYAVKLLKESFTKEKLLIRVPSNVVGSTPDSLVDKLVKEYPDWFYLEQE